MKKSETPKNTTIHVEKFKDRVVLILAAENDVFSIVFLTREDMDNFCSTLLEASRHLPSKKNMINMN